LGSKLCNGTEVVWGSASSLQNFHRLDLATPTPEALKECGIIDQISILGPFWKIDAYRGLLDTLKRLGYKDDQTLFVLSYDWRRSNLESAALLNNLISRINAPKVDIVSHSMGGLVSILYAGLYKGPSRINKMVFLGTPFLGSMNSLATLSDGWGGFQNVIAGGIQTIRRTALSFPSIYELLPRYENCCRVGTPASYLSVDPFDPREWRKYRWVTAEYDNGPRAAYFDGQLENAKKVGGLLERPLPAGIGISRIVGDAFGTNLYLYAGESDPSWKTWTFRKDRGDQTVPAWSAAGNIVSLEGTVPSYRTHGTIFNDPIVEEVLARELLDIAMPRKARVRALSTLSNPFRPFEFIDVSLDAEAVPVGQSTMIRLRIDWGNPVARGEYLPKAKLYASGSEIIIPFSDVTSEADLSGNALSFVGRVNGPLEPGQWRIVFDFGDFDAEYTTLLTTYVP
jgi:pimeloyl-ACP methyl ester carboxylesterase